MFCPNCGTKNEDDALFCASCGTKLEEAVEQNHDAAVESSNENQNPNPVQPQQNGFTPSMPNQQPWGQPQQNGFTPNQNGFTPNPSGFVPKQPTGPKQPVDKLMIISLIEVVVAILAIVVFFRVGNSAYGYERVAENYFIDVANADWDAAYEMLDISESDFVNKDSFIEANKYKEAIDFNTCDVEDSDSSKVSADVTITYREKGSSSTSSQHITLNKQKKKNFFFFDSWKVSSENYLIDRYYIYVPTGTTVKFDGEELASKYIESSDAYSDSYMIPVVFQGYHTISVEKEGYESVEETVYIEYDDDSYYIPALQISEETQEKLLNQAMEDTQKIFQAASEGKDFSEIKDLYAKSSDNSAKNYYSYLQDSFVTKDKKEGMTSFKITDCEASIISDYESEGTVYITVRLEIEAEVEYISLDWWTEKYEQLTSTDEEAYTIDYVLENGEWKINNGFMPYIYY